MKNLMKKTLTVLAFSGLAACGSVPNSVSEFGTMKTGTQISQVQMDQVVDANFILLATACCAVFAQNGESVPIQSATKVTTYIKAASPDAAGKVILTQGEVTTGVVLSRLSNGSCVENRSELVSLDAVVTQWGYVQLPRVKSETVTVACH